MAASEFQVGERVPVVTRTGTKTYRVTGVTAQKLPSQDTLFFTTAESCRLAPTPAGTGQRDRRLPRRGRLHGAEGHDGPGPHGRRTRHGGVPGRRERQGEADQPGRRDRRDLAAGGDPRRSSARSALSIQQRQREIALLRDRRGHPRQIRAMLGGEAVLIGLVAGVLGSAIGVGLGFWLRSRFVALGRDAG